MSEPYEVACNENGSRCIDITGNWRNGSLARDGIQTREPALAETETVTFHQVLAVPAGPCAIELEYRTVQDLADGRAIGCAYEGFDGLSVDGRPMPLAFRDVSGNGEHFMARAHFSMPRGNPRLQLALTVSNTRPLQTRLRFVRPPANENRFHALPPEGEGCDAPRGCGDPSSVWDGEHFLVRGIPFLLRKFEFFSPTLDKGVDRGSLKVWNGGMVLPCYGAQVKTAHFLGMIHNLDIGNGSWYCPKGDHGYSHFVGDRAGAIVVDWADGGHTVIPLVFGFNVWFSQPWDLIWRFLWDVGYGLQYDALLFGGREDYRDLIHDALALTDGVRSMGSLSNNARFIFSVDFEGRSAESIRVQGDDRLHDFPLVSAVTLETRAECSALPVLSQFGSEVLPMRTTTLDFIAGQDYRKGVEAVKRLFYTYVDDVPRLDEPEVPEGYFGPQYDFRGCPEAVYAATYLYRNGPECAAHIADSGTTPASSRASGALGAYTAGMGVWFKNEPHFKSIAEWSRLYREAEPGDLLGLNSAWAWCAGELLREAMAFGYDKFLDSYIAWLDGCLFEEAYPPHWNTQVGQGEKSAGWRRVQVGDVEERGTRENAGNGVCLWGRYMVWHWMGRPRDWNERHFAATEAAVEWIQWQLDTDTVYPGLRKDVLYTQSECAPAGYDIYSSFNALHGVKLAIRMAFQLDRIDCVERWSALYGRLQRGILDHLVDDGEDGPIWHTEPNCHWQDHAHKLVPVNLSAEGDSYTPLQDYASGDDLVRRSLEITRSSYRALMKEKNYNCLRMYGYGQGMMTQAALLLDEMEDATQFLNMLVNHCYLPHLGGWAAPEGVIVHRSGEYYLAVNGYMGQDIHLAASVKALRLVIGVDDNKPEHLFIVPRFPQKWAHMAIAAFPVLTGTQRQKLDYTYDRFPTGQSFDFNFERRVSDLSVRLGPLPSSKTIVRLSLDGKEVPFEVISSGDSRWVWVRNIAGLSGHVTVDYAPVG